MSTTVSRLIGLALVSLVLVSAGPSRARDGEAYLERQQALSAARQAREADRARVVRLRWESDRRRSAAHARMPDTMYASTPSAPAVELSCPVVTDDDVRRALQGFTSADEVTSIPLQSEDWLGSSDGGVFQSRPLQGVRGSSSRFGDDSAEPVAHDGWSPAFATSSASAAGTHLVPLFPSASDAALQGFVRVINHAGDAGEVRVDAVDDTGMSYGPLKLSIEGHQTVHFNSNDLEAGNAGKGLTGSTGVGEGDWRLTLSSDLDLEVLSYIRTTDGFLTAMHDRAPEADGVHRIAIFNPGSNTSQVSRLRLLNPGEEEAQVTIEGTDDRGMSPGDAVEVTVAGGASQTLTAAELESGGTGMTGALGDGAGKWRLAVTSEQDIHALSLLSSPTGHLTNLSTAPSSEVDGVHEVALFPSASDASGRQGFVRVINHGEETTEITITAHDETDWDYDPLTLSLAGGQVAHFNSNDLEQGNTGKGLTGSTGAGQGDWRLTLSSDADIEVLAYIRTTDGFLTAMHDLAPVSDTRHHVAIFNPGSNTSQVSRLRMVNGGDTAAEVTVTGVDDRGLSPGDDLRLILSAGAARTHTAQELESGAEGFTGALGDGAGKWRLEVTADQPIRVLSLLSSPTGHLTNLSTATARESAMQATAEEVFGTLISPIVQSQCVTCHVEGGVSGNTRLVFVTDDDADHLATTFSVFETFVAEVEDGADYILNKVQGVSHGGGIQLAAGSEGFAAMERFLGLLEGEEVGPVAITPANLFDGVKMEPWRNTLRRAAIIFAGRSPTEEEYASIRSASVAEFRAAIRNLMQGPEFHEFLIRAGNDRLLTDRNPVGMGIIDPAFGHFVEYTNELYRLSEAAFARSGDPYSAERNAYETGVQYGAKRAPLELIAHVVESDLPYTDILTADYVMANPFAAHAYGASTVFDNPADVHEFKPSEIVRYYRHGDGFDQQFNPDLNHYRIPNPGPLITRWPHAGILNTKVFLQRYPTTATNRNRARSRWTYYHFLGLDIEKSASRTTDPIALADTSNPTLNNPACTVCHTVLDPVAGAFQNYGNEGYYRDQWGGMDSLAGFYKAPLGKVFPVRAESYEERETHSFRTTLMRETRVLVSTAWNGNWDDFADADVALDKLILYNEGGTEVDRVEFEELASSDCGWFGDNETEDPADDHWVVHASWTNCRLGVPVEIPKDGPYRVDVVVWSVPVGHDDRPVQVRLAATPYRDGDTWYRGMREPGFDGGVVPDANVSLQWFAKAIVGDPRFAEATVRFWWPAIMATDVAEPPVEEADADFQGRLVASGAQTADVERLANDFRRGFRGRSPYNLKDLLVEMVLSPWFRADSLSDDDPVRVVALHDAGAKRLLGPEELARKTAAVTGFQWGRRINFGAAPEDERTNALTGDEEYRLLYGGIDSDGVTDRARDLTSVMAGVAKSHAVEASCPIVLREFYLLPDNRSRLFGGIDPAITPVTEFSGTFEIEADGWSDRETLALRGRLTAGNRAVALRFPNDHSDDNGDRNVRLYRLDVRDNTGELVVGRSLADEEPPTASWGSCGESRAWNAETGSHDHFNLHSTCAPLVIEFEAPTDGSYTVEVVAWADQYGDELAELDVEIQSDAGSSRGAAQIRAKLAELHHELLGVTVGPSSGDVDAAYRLFVDVWDRKSEREDDWFFDSDCRFEEDHRFFDGILDGALTLQENDAGAFYDYDYDRIWRFLSDEIDPRDPHGVTRTWVVVLAYLMMDYRYLYL